MYVVYILKSLRATKYYVGHTHDLDKRLHTHNIGGSRFTKAYTPWRVVYTEQFATKQEAYAREMQIKAYKGGRAFKSLLVTR